MDERPVELTRALQALTALVVIGGITVLFVVLFRDSLARAWAEGNPATRHLLRTQGLAAVRAGTVKPPHFVAPALTLYVVMVGLLWVLAQFLRNGFEWGRIGITVLLLGSAVASVGAILTDPPALFVVCTIVAIITGVTSLVLMWLPPVTRYIHPSVAAQPAHPAVPAARG
ncbi:hypothetical protein P5P86_08450 [Nocardioides sp. BP30]|uniref:hypothetical protein n=1 Tax=Nocardioides sp. BP30 TaxID=3036374 RepID=UPI002468BD50|nr:hypothetical protein [Nocardioides sp. BP30]WGL53847.1 hypothetical protein P5P86_08450 [Nocardioides sp. BP30]